MNIAQIKLAVKYLPTTTSILLKGTHGIGKTEFVSSLADELGLKLVIWHASHAADAGDITGLPYNDNGKTKFAPPEWMVQDQPVLVLLDEINRGLNIALNAIMQFTNNGTYDSISLPKGSRIIACINPEEDGKYDVGTMDAAQLDRFAIYDFKPTVEEWLEWATQKHISDKVINFISANPSYLDPYTNAELVQSVQGKDCPVLPSRRTYEKVSDVILAGDKDGAWDGAEGIAALSEIIQGLIGTGAMMKFMEFYKNSSNNLEPKKILTITNFDDALKKKIEKFSIADLPATKGFINGCKLYLMEHVDDLKNPETGKLLSSNFIAAIKSLNKDAMVACVNDVVYTACEKQELWALLVAKLQPELKEILRKSKICKDI